ncbi:protein draper-like isoform X2 [Haliotis rufescens]|uniref:protein draper-like isoform X2 n=1 Tax=Haliotis rufescens TaxID=6454 RepID=UPI00201EC922|nr:protein draper-like isoform X2 [Haliotis rufescens]
MNSRTPCDRRLTSLFNTNHGDVKGTEKNVLTDTWKMIFFSILLKHASLVIFAQDNIARGKPASQSSTWTYATTTFDAGKAVDGDVNTDFSHGSCSHTTEPNNGNASWHVFLGGTFLISRITIYLRGNSIGNNQAMEVLISGNTCRKLPVTDIRDSPYHLITNPVTLSCMEPTEGDNVTISMAGPYLALCEVQVFGKKKESCHCSNGCLNFPNTSCSTSSSGPVCKSPWFGGLCQMENIAFQKTARQSSTYNDGGSYCAAHAVDGNTDTDFSHRSCSHTNAADGGTASWQVLLDDHQMFNISRIRLYLRSDDQVNRKNMTVLVNGGLCNSASGTLDGTLGYGTSPFDITCADVMKGNSVTITMNGPFLALCEVQILVCSDGWFGSDCNKQCQCLNPSEVCDKGTGYCRSGCAAGKHGPGCQEVCSDGWFGSDCNKQCQCLNPSEVCDKGTGYCGSGCAAGKHGPGCQEVCSDGWFGSDCDKQCQCQNTSEVCDKETGNCSSGCAARKQGPACQQGTSTEYKGVASDVRFIVVCCVMAVLFVCLAVTTTLVVRLKQEVAKSKAERDEQYATLDTRGQFPVYDVIAEANLYSNDVQRGCSDDENTNTHVKKRDEQS